MRPEILNALHPIEMDPDMENEQIVLNKAGECLRYALGNELHAKDIDGIPNHLMAFAAYFFLMDKLDRNSANWFSNILRRRDYLDTDFKTFYRELSGFIVQNLKKHFHFDDSESMFAALDKVTIPDWAFVAAQEIMHLLPDVYLVKDRLYYLIERREGYYFRSVDLTTDADEIPGFDEGISADRSDTNRTVSKSYSRIIGYNPDEKVFYLQPKNTGEMFAVYDVDNDYETLYHYRCHGILGNVFPLIENDGYLAVIINGKVKPVRKIDPSEEYMAIGDYIRVEPAFGQPAFFKPYKLMIDGVRAEYSYDEQAAFLVAKIREQLDGDRRGFLGALFGKGNPESSAYAKGQIISPAYIDEILNSYDLDENRDARMYHIINRYLKESIPEDQDVLEYWYMFADVSRKLVGEPTSDLIDEAVYWRLNEVVLQGKLPKAIKTADTLRELLLKVTSWEESSPAEMKNGSDSEMKVGCFEFAGADLISERSEPGKMIVVGNNLMPENMNRPGIVFLDLEYGNNVVRYPRFLNKAEREKVLLDFSLEEENCRFCTDCRSLPEMT